VTDATETTAPEVDVAALLAENERLKGHHSKLLEETKTAKQKAAELEKAQQDAEIARQHEQGEYKTLAEKYKAEAEAERKEKLEDRAKNAAKDMDLAAIRIANEHGADAEAAELLFTFVRAQLDYIDGKVTGKDGMPVDDAINAMMATGKYEKLRKGNQASGGSAPGSKIGGGATKKFEELTGAELSAIRQKDPAQYDRLKADHTDRTRGY
jgi:hypothetical protein